jgi:hypothetical protein
MEDFMLDMEEQAVEFVMGVLRRASDWQEAQTALADHPIYGKWLEEGDDPTGDAQAIIREAEARLGPSLPY